jgi:hypothetical protein
MLDIRVRQSYGEGSRDGTDLPATLTKISISPKRSRIFATYSSLP